MTRRTRTIFILIGLLLVVTSLVALSFAWSPVETFRDQIPIAPTLLTLPPGGVP